MSDSKKAEQIHEKLPLECLREEVAKRETSLSGQILNGTVPSAAELDELDRLQRLRQILSHKTDKHRKRVQLALLCGFALLLMILIYIRVPSTAVDVEVHAQKIQMTLLAEHSSTLIPGEMGEILGLRQARVSGAEEVLPSGITDNGSFELRQLVPPASAPTKTSQELAVRLQEIAIPQGVPLKIATSVAYSADLRGLVFEASGAEASTARFGEVIPIASASGNTQPAQYAIRPVRASGKDLVLELFPADSEHELTVFRDTNISEISFEDSGHSTIFDGSILIKNGAEGGVHLQPSDHLLLRSGSPMLVRELTLNKGELKLLLSVPRATIIRSGDGSYDLMPTLFEWIRARWPAQLYATLSALVAFVLAWRNWWEASK